MPPPNLEAGPQTPESGAVKWAAAVVGVLVIAVNAWLVVQAAEDQSHGAIAIAFVVGPAANALMLTVALAVTPLVRRVLSATSMAPYKAVALVAPVAATLVDFVVIFSMPLHGS